MKPPRDCLDNAMLLVLGGVVLGLLLAVMRGVSLLVYGG